jgi:hypothetical protein
MKWFHFLLIATVAFAFNACEKHAASDLKLIDESKSEAMEKAEKKAEADSAKSEKAAKHGPAPKFFPTPR